MSEKPKLMMLYICKDCGLLLMRPDKKYELFDSSELKPNGWYDGNGNGEQEFAYFICPSCGNNSDIDNDYAESSEGKLSPIELPISLAPTLIKLWYKKRDAEVDTHDYEYGIPLEDEEAQTLLLEYLL